MLRVSLAHRIEGQLEGAGHKRSVPSSPPEARREPSGLKATLKTQSLWPSNGAPMACPDLASHSRSVPSSPPEARR